MIMYLTLVVLIIVADVLHGRRPPHPSEQLAAAADHGVAGLGDRIRAVMLPDPGAGVR